jgi:hypothetical protein
MISVETLQSVKKQASGKYSSIGAIKIMQKLNIYRAENLSFPLIK